MTALTDLAKDLQKHRFARLAYTSFAAALLSLLMIFVLPAFSPEIQMPLWASVLAFIPAVVLFCYPFTFQDDNGNYGWFRGEAEAIFSTILLVSGTALVPGLYLISKIVFLSVLLYALSVFAIAICFFLCTFKKISSASTKKSSVLPKTDCNH